MVPIEHLLSALDERVIAQRIGIPHDEARISYPLRSNTVSNFDEFSAIIGDYYAHHFAACVSYGGSLSPGEARSRAKEILEREYRREQGDVVTAYNDAHEGLRSGLRLVLDKLAEGLKAESVERYVRDLFDRHVAPTVWEDKVDLIRQFISQCGEPLASSARSGQPERYAHDYRDLIRSYVSGLQQTSAIFRRL